MQWKRPPIIKIYEALGAVADKRIEVAGNAAKVYSSSGNKYYDVSYDPDASAIMTNDNGAYWKGYLGYPAIAFLLQTGVLEYEPQSAGLLAGIKWKDVNQRFKNDFEKTLQYIEETMTPKDQQKLEAYANQLSRALCRLNLALLGRKRRPPQGY